MISQENDKYQVVVNDEEQYSIWQAGRDVPDGRLSVRKAPRDECLSYIAEHWTDRRPRSVREAAG